MDHLLEFISAEKCEGTQRKEGRKEREEEGGSKQRVVLVTFKGSKRTVCLRLGYTAVPVCFGLQPNSTDHSNGEEIARTLCENDVYGFAALLYSIQQQNKNKQAPTLSQ